MKGFKSKRGISLIVLVITIIVMIILAAAIILSISNSGIVDKANKAKQNSDIANLKEYVNVLEAEYELMTETEKTATGKTKTEYINTKLEEKGYNRKVTENGVLLTENATKAIADGLTIGDVVKYDVISKTETSKETDNGYEDQDISNQTDLTWRYIGESDEGEILIAPDMNKDIPKVYLYGATGYLKGPEELNRLCEVLYSTDKGTARSMTVEDINKLLGYTGEKGAYQSYNNLRVETTEALTIAELEKQNGTLTYRESLDGKDIGTYKADAYAISKEDDVSKMKYPDNRAYVYYGTGRLDTADYWLSSRCIFPIWFSNLDGVNYCVRSVGLQSVAFFWLYCTVPGNESEAGKRLRPVVTITSTITKNASTDVWEFAGK